MYSPICQGNQIYERKQTGNTFKTFLQIEILYLFQFPLKMASVLAGYTYQWGSGARLENKSKDLRQLSLKRKSQCAHKVIKYYHIAVSEKSSCLLGFENISQMCQKTPQLCLDHLPYRNTAKEHLPSFHCLESLKRWWQPSEKWSNGWK